MDTSISFTIVQSLLVFTLLVLALLLLLLPQGKKSQNLPLSMFLGIISVHILIDLTINQPIFNNIRIHLFPSVFIFLYAPLLFFYTNRCINNVAQQKWRHLVLFLVFGIYYWVDGFSSMLYFPIYGIQYLIYGIWISRLIRKHKWDKAINKIWLLFLVYSFGLIWFFVLLANGFSWGGLPYWADQLELISYLVATLFFVGLLYFMMSRPSLFMNVRVSTSNQDRVPENVSDIERKRIKEIRSLFEEEKIFKNPDLNRTTLADRLGINQQQLSKEINQHFKMNLSELLNFYRIKEAQALLKNKNYNIKEVYYEVGYNSRSAFNNAFKKIVKKTPTQFRNEEAV